jgi:sulfide:quinone oxidoreductase
MPMRVVVLGAGFGGLELSTLLSDALGEDVDVTLIDKGDGFVFGFSKLDVVFGHATPDAVWLPYSEIAKPGVRFVKETVTAIDAETRSVTTDAGTYEGDALVIALGADYDWDATPGLAAAESEFYSVPGAEHLATRLPDFTEGRAVIAVGGAPFKCPPAPSEAALMLHDHLVERGVRDRCQITFAIPLPTPVPPSPETSRAFMAEFEQRGIEFIARRRLAEVDSGRGVATLDDGTELAYDLLLGVPKHCAPEVVVASGLVDEAYIPVNPRTLETRFEGVYAVGDCAAVGVPKAGVFAEGAARIVAASLIADAGRGERPGGYEGRGSCYVEFGGGRVARVDVDFLGGPEPTGSFQAPSVELAAEKKAFGSTRRASWFGRGS